MTGWRLTVGIAALIGVAACQPVPVVPPPEDPLATCGADRLQGLVGQSRRVLQTMRFGGPTRIIEPGSAVTMDYAPERLNIWIGQDWRIARVTCG